MLDGGCQGSVPYSSVVCFFVGKYPGFVLSTDAYYGQRGSRRIADDWAQAVV